MIRKLQRGPWGREVFAALTLLADHLDQHGSPIDYARRRAAFGQRWQLVDADHWADLQKRSGRRVRRARRPEHGQRWLYELLTASPADAGPPHIAFPARSDRSDYQRFRMNLSPAQCDGLLTAAQGLLDREGIDEPVAWSPNLDLAQLQHLTLPGPEPDSLDPASVHRAALAQTQPAAQGLADALGTTSDHVRYLLDAHPRDRRRRPCDGL